MHSCIPWTENLGEYSPWSHKESDMTERLNFHFSLLLRTPFILTQDHEEKINKISAALKQTLVSHQIIHETTKLYISCYLNNNCSLVVKFC